MSQRYDLGHVQATGTKKGVELMAWGVGKAREVQNALRFERDRAVCAAIKMRSGGTDLGLPAGHVCVAECGESRKADAKERPGMDA